jgi:hypothetical protein
LGDEKVLMPYILKIMKLREIPLGGEDARETIWKTMTALLFEMGTGWMEELTVKMPVNVWGSSCWKGRKEWSKSASNNKLHQFISLLASQIRDRRKLNDQLLLCELLSKRDRV